jgi:hypothetical protein
MRDKREIGACPEKKPAPAKAGVDAEVPKKGQRSADEAKRRADYARQIARSEFGRFYWNDQQARLLQEAMNRRPKPDGRARPPRKTSP